MQQMQVSITANLLYTFRASIDPIIRSTQTVTTASGTGRSIRATTFCQRGLIRPRWQKVVALIRDMTCTRSCSYSLICF